MVEWIVLGALALIGLAMSARIMRRGLPTLDDNRKSYMEKIHATERRLAEDRKNISSAEHLDVMGAALRDLLRLDGNPEGFSVRKSGDAWELETPEGAWRVELLMREKSLRTSGRVLHGRSRWVLSGFDIMETHPDPASLMRSLNAHLHAPPDAGKTLPPIPGIH